MNAPKDHDNFPHAVPWRRPDDRVRARETKHTRREHRAFATGALLAGLLLTTGTALSQAGAEALVIDAMGRLGIGNRTPVAQVDVQQEPRTSADSHSKTTKVMYVTGALDADAGIEFRHTNGSQGIGFGFNTIYAAGSNANQDLHLKARGTGNVVVDGFIVGKGTVPKGAILMWSGNPAQLPPGWVLCDGTQGTPDLRGRFIVGYDPRDGEYNTVRNTGGQRQVPVGEHTHQVNGGGSATGSHYHHWAASPTTQVDAGVQVYGPGTGGVVNPASQENRPPYLVLAYVMYAGPAN